MADPQLRAIFCEALERKSPQERAEYLNEACQGRPELRARVEVLLEAHVEASSFLREAPVPSTIVAPPTMEAPGAFIGPYKLLEQIGEGGFGVVFMAEQHEPIRRKVALKVLKPGMDTRQIVARFEAERQALAIMDHPHIAKVFDGGATASGRPYFVMELVKGVPLTQFCDQARLAPRERLELFVHVCQAVQHAHQKGIIHRDLKPSNVLVTLQDGTPRVKVIDFGIAKAMGQQLTDKSLFTGFAQMIGTPLYMSPEQAGQSFDIDTRSDIYSLGVMLYELLTGTTPFTRERFKQAAFDEIRRIIREEEPPKPSTRLSESKDSLPSVSAQRQTEPAKLTKLVRGELDWIVMKALEKDRNRRYETANALAADLQCYLNDDPVMACPPSAGYRLRKFLRRNKAGVGTAALVLFFLVVLGGGIGWAVRDRAEREHRLAAQVELILDDVGRLEREQQWPEALAMADRAEAALAGGDAGDAIRQRVREARRELAFVAQLERIRQDRAIVVEGKYNDRGAVEAYGRAFREFGVDVENLPTDQAVAQLRAWPSLAAPVAAALDNWTIARRKLGEDGSRSKPLVAVARGIDSNPLRDRLRAMFGQPVAPQLQAELRQLAETIDIKAQTPATLITLAWTLRDMRLADSAIQILKDGQDIYPNDFWLNLDLGLELHDQGDYVQAIRYLQAAVAVRPDSAASRTNLGSALYRAKDMNGSIRQCRAALQLDPKNGLVHFNLGTALFGTKDLEGAIREYRAALEIDPNYAIAHCNLGTVLREAMDLEGAIRELHAALQIDPNLADAHNNLGLALHDKKDFAGAIREYQAALKNRPKFAAAHHNLGNALRAKNDLDGAIREWQAAVTIDRNFTDAHNNLGAALAEKGNMDESIREYRLALQIEPNNFNAHYNLGNTLTAKHDLEGARDEFRKAVALNPNVAEARCNLGQTLRQLGQYAEALEELRRGHELGSKRSDWPYPSADWVRQCERLVELETKLAAVLEGKTTPTSANERIELAELSSLKRLHRAAARFYEEAFAADPKLAQDADASHRYNAACAAALAGCGVGDDAEKIDAAGKARLRRQALDWLQVEVDAIGRLLQTQPESARSVASALQHWLTDADLAGVRGPEALAKLPAAERQQWQKLWQSVADLLKQAQGKATPGKKAPLEPSQK